MMHNGNLVGIADDAHKNLKRTALFLTTYQYQKVIYYNYFVVNFTTVLSILEYCGHHQPCQTSFLGRHVLPILSSPRNVPRNVKFQALEIIKLFHVRHYPIYLFFRFLRFFPPFHTLASWEAGTAGCGGEIIRNNCYYTRHINLLVSSIL